MAAELILTPEAAQDVSDAYAWYEECRYGLGEDFLGSIDACIRRICRMPELHAKVHEDYRRVLVRRFPYALFYEYSDGTVTLYGVCHTAQRPDKWRERLP